ncbi:MAG TPA: hypothetical protein VGG11_08420 [Xanthobacteraceae bacterium]|jgi:hypothetical protein
MSSPVNQASKLDEAIKYAPPWVRDDARLATLVPDTAKIEWPPRSRSPLAAGRGFSGDVAARELQRQVRLDPEKVPEPVKVGNERSAARLALRICAAVGAAAIAAGAIVTVPLLRSGANAEVIGAAIMALVVGGGKQDQLAVPTPEARLLVRDDRGEPNEILPVGIEIDGNSAGTSVVLSGLAPDTQLSAGSALGVSGWRLDADQLAGLEIRPPRDYVGVMNAMVDLRLPGDRVAESKGLRLEWVARPQVPVASAPPSPAVPAATLPLPAVAPAAVPTTAKPQAPAEPQTSALHLDPSEVAILLKRGQDTLKNGDLVAARLLLQRAAAAGSADGAFALAQTFDPVVVARLGAVGVAADAAKAREWYQKAAHLGSGVAAQQVANFQQKTE